MYLAVSTRAVRQHPSCDRISILSCFFRCMNLAAMGQCGLDSTLPLLCFARASDLPLLLTVSLTMLYMTPTPIPLVRRRLTDCLLLQCMLELCHLLLHLHWVHACVHASAYRLSNQLLFCLRCRQLRPCPLWPPSLWVRATM